MRRTPDEVREKIVALFGTMSDTDIAGIFGLSHSLVSGIRRQAGLPSGTWRPSLEERFFAKVDRSGGPDACHVWKAALSKTGYGKFQRSKGVTVAAHRQAWDLEHGPLEAKKMVLHDCDNPPCVNHRHLFLGDVVTNARDMAQKGRGRQSPSGYPRGVSRTKEGRFAAYAWDGVRRQKLYLGVSDVLEEAAEMAARHKALILVSYGDVRKQGSPEASK